MKKKIIALLIAGVTLFSVTSCSNGSDDTPEPSQTEETPETSEYVSKEFSGLSFEIPSDAEYTESDESATIIFEDQKKVAVIVPTDTSELGDSLSEVWNEYAITSALSACEEIQNQQDSDIDIAGVNGKNTTAMVKLSDSWYSCSITSFTKDDLQCQYSISYLVSTDADEDNSAYESFMESIDFEE